jgi:hypothetical protein
VLFSTFFDVLLRSMRIFSRRFCPRFLDPSSHVFPRVTWKKYHRPRGFFLAAKAHPREQYFPASFLESDRNWRKKTSPQNRQVLTLHVWHNACGLPRPGGATVIPPHSTQMLLFFKGFPGVTGLAEALEVGRIIAASG